MSCILSILDELIRQVTINCAERGLLLLRYVYMHYCSEKLNEVLFVEYKVQYILVLGFGSYSSMAS